MHWRGWNDLAQIVIAIVTCNFFDDVNFDGAIVAPRWDSDIYHPISCRLSNGETDRCNEIFQCFSSYINAQHSLNGVQSHGCGSCLSRQRFGTCIGSARVHHKTWARDAQQLCKSCNGKFGTIRIDSPLEAKRSLCAQRKSSGCCTHCVWFEVSNLNCN